MKIYPPISVGPGSIRRPAARTDSGCRAFCRFTGALIACVLIVITAVSVVAADEEDCLDCHPEAFERLGGVFNHEPFNENDCYACHIFHGFRNKSELFAPTIEVCASCHESMRDMDEEYTHYPILDDGSCLTCHSPHGADNKKLLVKPVSGELCTECHEGPDAQNKGTHEPFAQKKCINCHDPHISTFPGFLLFPADYVCVDCHAGIVSGLDIATMHGDPDGGESSCLGCHAGHQSDYPHLTIAAQPALCLNCHKELSADMDKLGQHTALAGGDCTDCHLPHFAVTGTFLNEESPGLCFSCHADIEEATKAATPHAAVDEGCSLCHSPHTKGLLEPEAELCGTCHDAADTDFKARHADLAPSTCSGCHAPHGADQSGLLLPVLHLPFADRECDACHEHAETPAALREPDLCLNCHDVTESDAAHGSTAWESRVCVDCHSPHASNSSQLLK